MVVNQELCIGCGKCTAYCPVHAISVVSSKASIDLALCTECANCQRSNICPRSALVKSELEWPRQVRAQMSDVKTEYKGVNGRGTEEMKTNDVTHRYVSGFAGVAIELGRPGVSASLRDLEKVSMAVAPFDITFETLNPVTSFIEDKKTGKIRSDILDERVLSGIIEFSVPIGELKDVLNAVFAIEKELDTVFSLDVACVADEDGTIQAKKVLDECAIPYRPNCKTNVGLGHMF